MSLEKADGIIIKRTSLNDNDVILTIFSKERGKIQAIVKGGKKTKSPFLGSTQLFCYTQFVYYTGKNFDYINQTQLISSFYSIRNELERLSIATYMLDIILNSFETEQKEERIFYLLLYSLNTLNKCVEMPKLLLLTFQMKIAGLMGYAPEFIRCSKCHDKIEKTYYSRELGGFICENCLASYPYADKIKDEQIKLLEKLLYIPMQEITKVQIRQQLNFLVDIMNKYITYHIDKKLYSYEFLEII